MPIATIDGIETRYETVGAGPALLMFSPGGFDSSLENWTSFGRYRDLGFVDALSPHYTCVVFDRREAGRGGEQLRYIGEGPDARRREAGTHGGFVAAARAVAFPQQGRDALVATGRHQLLQGVAADDQPALLDAAVEVGVTDPSEPHAIHIIVKAASQIGVIDSNFAQGCCPQAEVTATADIDTMVVTPIYTLTGDDCDCVTGLELSYTLTGLPTGRWTVTYGDASSSADVP